MVILQGYIQNPFLGVLHLDCIKIAFATCKSALRLLILAIRILPRLCQPAARHPPRICEDLHLRRRPATLLVKPSEMNEQQLQTHDYWTNEIANLNNQIANLNQTINFLQNENADLRQRYNQAYQQITSLDAALQKVASVALNVPVQQLPPHNHY
uniref:Spore coat protein n=1 Tax=Panagrellus redivivus TaxID=6233 RepID=A0A7E4W417_PANRE